MSIRLVSLLAVLSLLGACAPVATRTVTPSPANAAAVAEKPAATAATPAAAKAEPAPRAGLSIAAEPSEPARPSASPAPSKPVSQPPATPPKQAASKPAPAVPAKPVVSQKPVAKPKPTPEAKPEPKPAPTVAAVAPASIKLSGKVALQSAGGQSAASGEQANTVIYFVPASGAIRPKPGNYTVYTHDRDFSPEALSVPIGSKVTFINLDDVRHNVFSVTPGNSFDLGYQSSGEKASHGFSRAGLVLVSCNVHRSMELDMLVVPSAFATHAAADGSFSLDGLPAGPGTLHFWNPRAQPTTQKVVLPMGKPVQQSLKLIRPSVTVQLHTGA